MKTQLYELEKRLGITGMKKCTPEEVDAIKRVLSQGRQLPVGIFCSKRGEYFKYIDEGFTDEEKERFVKYKGLVNSNKMIVCSYVIICLLAVVIILLAVMLKLMYII